MSALGHRTVTHKGCTVEVSVLPVDGGSTWYRISQVLISMPTPSGHEEHQQFPDPGPFPDEAAALNYGASYGVNYINERVT